MTTYVLTGKQALEEIPDLLKRMVDVEKSVVLVCFDLAGTFQAPSKRKNYYQVGFGIAEVFKKKGTLHNILDSKMFVVVVVDRNKIDPKYLKEIEKGEGDKK